MREFFLQDKRQYVGNCLLFWAKRGGYTTNIDEAKRFSQEDAFKQNRERPDVDIPIPCDYVLERVERTIDAQRVSAKNALSDIGLSLHEVPKPKYVPLKCYSCGRILRVQDYYGLCPNCGACNRP